MTAGSVTRLGAVCYLNARPLVYGLDRDPRFAVRNDVPSLCADLLLAGEIDLGLIPAFEYARVGDYLAVPDIAIASDGAVDSVALFTTRPIEDVRSIALDTSSRTSANLVRLLCAARFGIAPAFRPAAPDLKAMLHDADAALLIGDPALFTDPDTLGVQKIDLGVEWKAMTGLPFVWAFWTGRPGSASPAVCAALRETRDRGLAAVDDIARQHAQADPAKQALIARYLRQAILFDFHGPFVEGLRTYYRLLHQHRILERPAELRFYESAVISYQS